MALPGFPTVPPGPLARTMYIVLSSNSNSWTIVSLSTSLAEISLFETDLIKLAATNGPSPSPIGLPSEKAFAA